MNMLFNLCYFIIEKFYMVKEITLKSLEDDLKAKNYLDVIKGSKALLEKGGNSLECEILLASALVQSEEFIEGGQVFLDITKKYKQFPSTVYYNLSSAYLGQNRFKDALFNARQYVNQNTTNIMGYLRLGELYTKLFLPGERKMSYFMALGLDPENHAALRGLSECFRTEQDSEGALRYLSKQKKTPRRDMNMLEAHYFLGNKLLFNNKLLELNKEEVLIPLVACLSAHASIRFSQKDNYQFCPNPFNYIQHLSLGEGELNKSFIQEVISTIERYNFSYTPQNLLINGTQTLGPGNIFNLKDDCIVTLKTLVESKIKEYRDSYKTEDIGFFKRWPNSEDYDLQGWVIDLKAGGSLKRHIHKEGWLSGSLYLSIPDKEKLNEGDIVFSLDGNSYPTDGKFYTERVVGLNTGDMVLFPSSIFHSTIPFSAKESRITLAFDIIPKYMKD